MKKLLPYLCLMISILDAVSQEYQFKQKKAGIIINNNLYLSGNGLGSFYNPSIVIEKEKFQVGIGPCIQTQFKKLEGIRATTNFVISPYQESLYEPFDFKLSLIGNLQYYWDAPLSKSFIDREFCKNHDVKSAELIRIKNLELTSGFSIEKNIGKNLFIAATIAVGATINLSHLYQPHIYKVKPINQFGVTVGYYLKK